ncbi:MAG: hypothetical protein WA958_02085 [Tunicatimonas sp.]
MQDLQHLVSIVKKKSQRSLQLVNYNFRKKETSKDNLLYQGIVNTSFTSDEDAARAIFRVDPGNRNYRNAKGKLRTKLLNHLFFLDYEKASYTLYERVRYDSEKTLLQCKILINEGAADIALRILPTLLRTAKEFELYGVAVSAARLLRDQYALIGKLTPFEEASDDLRTYEEKLASYERCQTLLHQSLVHVNKSVSAQKRILSEIPTSIAHIRREAKKHRSNTLDVLASQLELVCNGMERRFADNIKLCTQLEKQYLKGANDTVRVPLSKKQIALAKAYAYLNAPSGSQGVAYAKSALKLFRPSGLDWFSFAEHYFLLLMREERYEEARALFRKVRTNKNYSALEEADAQRWFIYRAYLIFFNDAKILRWGFNLDEFTHQPPAFENDSFTIAARVAQCLFLLREGRVEEVKTCVAKLSEYKSSHLDKRHNYRSSIFIRLLEIMVEKEFDFERVSEKGNSYYKKLIRNNIPNELATEVEVVPYQKLWMHLLSILRVHKVYLHYRFYHTKVDQMA